MTGTTTSFPFKIIPTKPTKTLPLLLSSLESKPSGIHFPVPTTFSSVSLHCSASITPLNGGGDSRFYDPALSKKKDDYDPLDLSVIRSDTVRLINEQQTTVEIVTKSRAIEMAEEAELDLVIIALHAKPPVVRIVDYKYDILYDNFYNIDQHDYAVRLKAARKFLNDGDKVKVIVNLKGRENEFRNMAMDLISRFQNDVGELATEERKKSKDKNIFIILVPNMAVVKKAQQDPGKKKDEPTKNEVSASV
ncbi:hypothetical protein V6N13_107775 [Hibiscus sabdariffa]